MAKVTATAFFNDELFGPVIHPKRDEYPEDTYKYWLKRIKKNWDYSFAHFMVVTVPKDDGEGDEVVSWGQWNRLGKAMKEEEATKPKPEVPAYENRAADPELEDVMERSYPYLYHEWSGESFLGLSSRSYL
jgi:hypothetical protein